MSGLARLEAILDASGIAQEIEALLPVGVRERQLSARTLLLGMLLALSDGRPAHLVRVHAALLALPDADKRRLGVLVLWKEGEHLLSYRQVQRTFSLAAKALAKERPDGEPSEALCGVMDRLLEASVEVLGGTCSRSLAVDWTDCESHFRPAHGADGRCVEGEASWRHRRGDGPGQKDEAFFGYYLQAATIVCEERAEPVAELVRRMLLSSCKIDPPGAFVAVLGRMAKDGIELGDLLADCGYSYREPTTWALPLRRLGAALVQDIHPNDRGRKGTHQGAVISNGNLYCPATPAGLLELSAPARAAGAEELQAHDKLSEELAHYKLGAISAADQDGFQRVLCPAVAGKCRCPLRERSMTLSFEHPQVLDPPEHSPPCCCQQTITVPVQVNAKTKQKHDWPSAAHRRSYARRSAAERSFSTIKDPATNDISAKGWCRIAGLSGTSLFLACLFVVRNIRVADAFSARKADEARRQACGLPARRRRRRRQTLSDLLGAANAPPA